jgi:hypothetical protein
MDYFVQMGAVVGVTLKGWFERDGAPGAGSPSSVNRTSVGVTLATRSSNHTGRGAVRFR